MKIRTGFVSNSSSSSFIIDPTSPNSQYKTVWELAQYMIERNQVSQNREYNDGGEGEEKGLRKSKELVEEVKALNLDPDTPICMSSCNYDTFIFKHEDGKIYVDTCNNVDWNLQGNDIEWLEGLYEEDGYPQSGNVEGYFNIDYMNYVRNTTYRDRSYDEKLPCGCSSWNKIIFNGKVSCSQHEKIKRLTPLDTINLDEEYKRAVMRNWK